MNSAVTMQPYQTCIRKQPNTHSPHEANDVQGGRAVSSHNFSPAGETLVEAFTRPRIPSSWR